LFPPLLHRTAAPTAAELNGWVNSNSDILMIEVSITGSAEFFVNG